MAMKHVSGPIGKGILFSRHLWRLFVATGMVMTMLVAFFSFTSASMPLAFANAHVFSAKHSFTSSPTQGPVGAVITVTGTDLTYPDGSQVTLGYTTNFSTCNIASDAQAGKTSNHAFSGWFRWPTSTGAGNFGVCAYVSGATSFVVGNYQVLSVSAPQVTVSPTTLNAGKPGTVNGANFLPTGTSVYLLWQAVDGSQTLTLGTVTASATGTFSQTFTVPANVSTGSYTITATVGNSQPPTLSATITFHVNGITIAPVSTPGAHASPTAAAQASATVNATVATTPIAPGQTGGTNRDAGGLSGSSSLLLPIVLVGLLLIVAALIAGVLVVRRQRRLASFASAGNAAAWSAMEPTSMNMNAQFSPGPTYHTGGLTPPGNPRLEHSPRLSGPIASSAVQTQGPGAIPFDPALAEAMRQAQVSLFAMPRPPIKEEVSS
jgi:hypothetical protein